METIKKIINYCINWYNENTELTFLDKGFYNVHEERITEHRIKTIFGWLESCPSVEILKNIENYYIENIKKIGHNTYWKKNIENRIENKIKDVFFKINGNSL